MFALPIAVIQIALRGLFPGYQGWADFFLWLCIFIYGFILFAGMRYFKFLIHRQWKFTLCVAIACVLIMLGAAFAGVLNNWDTLSSFSPGYVLYQVLRSIVIWSLMVFVLFFGMRCLQFNNRFIDYCYGAVLPFYIFHYFIIFVITFFSLGWNINMGVKYLLVSTAALLTTLAVYELGIRRIKVSRWLFGLSSS